MTLATATSALESRFDHFLYAAVREDPDGTPLTVLSVLARLDMDPWKEAARLARLPREAAARAFLAVLISALPKGCAMPPDSEKIAARLITLLPRESERGIAQKVPSGEPRAVRMPDRATIVARAVLCLIILALLLVSQWVAVSHRESKKPLTAPATVAPARAAPPDARQ